LLAAAFAVLSRGCLATHRPLGFAICALIAGVLLLATTFTIPSSETPYIPSIPRY
jgi:hypothetical protein